MERLLRPGAPGPLASTSGLRRSTPCTIADSYGKTNGKSKKRQLPGGGQAAAAGGCQPCRIALWRPENRGARQTGLSGPSVSAAARAPWRAPGRGPGPSARSSRALGAPLGPCGKSLKTIEKTNANRKVLRNPDRGAWGQLLAAVRRATASTGHPRDHRKTQKPKNPWYLIMFTYLPSHAKYC